MDGPAAVNVFLSVPGCGTPSFDLCDSTTVNAVSRHIAMKKCMIHSLNFEAPATVHVKDSSISNVKNLGKNLRNWTRAEVVFKLREIREDEHVMKSHESTNLNAVPGLFG